MDRDSLCVHGGGRDDSQYQAAVVPIYQSSTFALNDAAFEGMISGNPRDCLIYSRYGNPTTWSLEKHLAALENAESAVVTASGMAAISATLLALTKAGDHIIVPMGAYGQTVILIRELAERSGREMSTVPTGEVDEYRAALRSNTKLLWAESLGNPVNFVADLPALAELAHGNGAKLAVDATFASPVLQRPLDHGVNVVVHSATKYLNGHTDLSAGAAAGSKEHIDAVWNQLRMLGGCLDPHAAFLLQRGLRTLHLRMERTVQNAMAIAEFLDTQDSVLAVHYPGLPGHPMHKRAVRLLPDGCGGIVSFTVCGGDEAALRFCKALKMVFEATSLGGVESLVSLPFNTSHASLSAADREKAGIPAGTVRLAVGIESSDDLIADLAQALQTACPQTA